MRTGISARIFLIAFIICLTGKTISQTVTVDGNIFLLGESQHDSIMIAFQRVAPSLLRDTVYTNGSGYFSTDIEEGVWAFAYHKPGFSSKYYEDTPIYSDFTVPDTIMEPAICGAIKDTLKSGRYLVTCNLLVNAGDTLVIEAGTDLLFANGSRFIVSGLLLVEGEETNKVTFDWDAEGNHWQGIRLQGSGLNHKISHAIVRHSNLHGIEVRSSKLEIDHSVISDNIIPNEYCSGLTVYRANVSMVNCTFSSNKGGAIYCTDGAFDLDACTFTENTAKDGGAIRTSGATIKIFNSLFYQNTAQRGGAMFPGYARTTIINSAFIDNTIDPIYAPSTYDSKLMVYNSLFMNSNKGIHSGHAFVEFKNNLFWNLGDEGKDIVDTYRPQYIEWFAEIVTTNINEDSTDAYGNLFLDPYLVNVPGADYHATDSGRTRSQPPTSQSHASRTRTGGLAWLRQTRRSR